MLRTFFLYVVSLCQRRSLPTRRDENEGEDDDIAPRLVRVDANLPQWFQRNVRARLRWTRAVTLVRKVLRLRKRWSYIGALLNTRRNSLPPTVLNNVRRYFSRLGRTLRFLNSAQLCEHLVRKSGNLEYKRS